MTYEDFKATIDECFQEALNDPNYHFLKPLCSQKEFSYSSMNKKNNKHNCFSPNHLQAFLQAFYDESSLTQNDNYIEPTAALFTKPVTKIHSESNYYTEEAYNINNNSYSKLNNELKELWNRCNAYPWIPFESLYPMDTPESEDEIDYDAIFSTCVFYLLMYFGHLKHTNYKKENKKYFLDFELRDNKCVVYHPIFKVSESLVKAFSQKKFEHTFFFETPPLDINYFISIVRPDIPFLLSQHDTIKNQFTNQLPEYNWTSVHELIPSDSMIIISKIEPNKRYPVTGIDHKNLILISDTPIKKNEFPLVDLNTPEHMKQYCSGPYPNITEEHIEFILSNYNNQPDLFELLCLVCNYHPNGLKQLTEQICFHQSGKTILGHIEDCVYNNLSPELRALILLLCYGNQYFKNIKNIIVLLQLNTHIEELITLKWVSPDSYTLCPLVIKSMLYLFHIEEEGFKFIEYSLSKLNGILSGKEHYCFSSSDIASYSYELLEFFISLVNKNSKKYIKSQKKLTGCSAIERFEINPIYAWNIVYANTLFKLLVFCIEYNQKETFSITGKLLSNLCNFLFTEDDVKYFQSLFSHLQEFYALESPAERDSEIHAITEIYSVIPSENEPLGKIFFETICSLNNIVLREYFLLFIKHSLVYPDLRHETNYMKELCMHIKWSEGLHNIDSNIDFTSPLYNLLGIVAIRYYLGKNNVFLYYEIACTCIEYENFFSQNSVASPQNMDLFKLWYNVVNSLIVMLSGIGTYDKSILKEEWNTLENHIPKDSLNLKDYIDRLTQT